MFNTGGTLLSKFSDEGGLYINISSASAFRIDNGSGTNRFNFDSQNGGSLTLTSAQTTGAVASISAISLTSGNVLEMTVPASTSGGGAYLLVKDTAGVVYASLSNGGRFTIRRTMFSRGADVTNCTGVGAPSAGCLDYAENYPTQDNTLEAGEIVAVDPSGSFGVVRASGSSTLLGIVSTNPAVLITENHVKTGDEANQEIASSSGQVPIALAGRVPVKVTEENGQIEAGDRLTVSKTKPGYAMRASEAGMTIGIALEGFPRSDLSLTNTRSDLVLVFVNLSYWMPTINEIIEDATASGSNITVSSSGAIPNLGDLFASIINQFASVFDIVFERGLLKVANVIVEKLTAKELAADKLCIGQTCVTENELKALLESNNLQSTTNDSQQISEPTPEPTPEKEPIPEPPVE